MSFGSDGSEDGSSYWSSWLAKTPASTYLNQWQQQSEAQTFDWGLNQLSSYAPLRVREAYGPTSGYGESYAPTTSYSSVVIGNMYDAWLANEHHELLQAPTTDPGGPQYAPGMATPTDPAWKSFNTWDPLIRQYTAQVAGDLGVIVPGNVVKALARVMRPEGFPGYDQATGASGILGLRAGGLGDGKDNGYDYSKAVNDPNYALYAGIQELALRYLDAKTKAGSSDWTSVINSYFTGQYGNTAATDPYSQSYQQYYNELEKLSSNQPNANGTFAPSAGTQQWKATWGGTEQPISQEFGPTPFAASHADDWYAFVTQYGLPAGSHPGIDVAVPDGTTLFTPVNGTVINAGGTGYYQDDRYGNAPGTGELRIQLDNGDQIILGHMSQIGVKPGDRVNAGTAVGKSGIANGNHVHLEYRHYDPTFNDNPEHMRILDPRAALAGNFTGSYSQQTGYGGQVQTPTVSTWDQFMQAAASGQPLFAPGVSGYGQKDAFTGYLLGKMANVLGLSGIPMPKTYQAPPVAGWTGGKLSNAGGEWALLDQQNANLNAAVQRVQQETGIAVPANLIKGMLAREGSYGRDFYVTNLRNDQILAYNGVFRNTAESYGLNWNQMISDKGYAAYATAYIMAALYKQQGGQYGWEGAASTYFGGSPTGQFTDELGNTTSSYLYGPTGVVTHWHNLDQQAAGGG